ncbi:hypothetical protein T12_2488 [Trichinella patagoniensis]|uniref:Uncharacterized protein n=1 Tax=Trichinella patagoniensis TaxID=990121 RepID=A0A0V1AD29_9BILA|nr:hypothetical protein T12_2488 [Trichinella patagoniensis]
MKIASPAVYRYYNNYKVKQSEHIFDKRLFYYIIFISTKNMRAVGLQQDVDGMIHTAKTCELERIPSSILKCQSHEFKSEMLCCQKERENLSNSVLNDKLHVQIVKLHLFSA